MPTESLHQIEDAWALVDELGDISERLSRAVELAKKQLPPRSPELEDEEDD